MEIATAEVVMRAGTTPNTLQMGNAVVEAVLRAGLQLVPYRSTQEADKHLHEVCESG